MPDNQLLRSPCFRIGLTAGFLTLGGCGPNIPEACGNNVAEVVSIDFTGPSVVDDAGSGYDVAITIEKENSGQIATVCYAVRDDDGLFNVDDVLAAQTMVFAIGESTKSAEGAFVLFNGNGELCGSGLVASQNGCADESKTGVYLDVIDSDGDSSPKHEIGIE